MRVVHQWWLILGLLLVAPAGNVISSEWSIAPSRGPTTWGNQETLADHFKQHGKDFGSRNAQHCADQASDFLRSSRAQRLPTKIDADGVIRVYDPKTNTFGSFNPDGSTKTFFKPTRGVDYWNSQPGVAPWEAPK